MRRSGLSRVVTVLDQQFISTRIGDAISLSASAIQGTLSNGLGLDFIRWERQEILTPAEKPDYEKPFDDPGGIELRAMLSDRIMSGWIYRGGVDNQRLLEHFYERGHQMMYKRNHLDDGIDMRNVFFRNIAVIRTANGFQSVHIRAIVRAWALSSWWEHADVKIWAQTEDGVFRGFFYYNHDGNVMDGGKQIPSQPPPFLSFD